MSKNLIYHKISEKGVKISSCCEVGVYLPETSNILDFIEEGVATTLVEPDPSSIRAIKQRFKGYGNIKLYEVAVFDKQGTISLSKANASTFVNDLPYSPATVNDQYKVKESESFTVPCDKFSNLDPGNIDLLSIDTEGCEWYVLQDLISKPKIISIETHGKLYVNPYMDQIGYWMNKNNYKPWFKDKSDTVFFREGIITLSLKDRIGLIRMNINLSFTRFIKSLARLISGK